MFDKKRQTGSKAIKILCMLLFFLQFAYVYADVAVNPESDHALDPFEKTNRIIFNLNDVIDRVFLKPVAILYNKIIPRPLNQGINNIFNNLDTIPTIANDFLQLHWYQMLNDVWRFGINSTIGLGGLIDVGSRMNLNAYENDFGLTLARYGWRQSTYIVWPLFGPSSIRDGIEIPTDYYLFSIYPLIKPTATRLGLYGLGVVDRRAQLLQFQPVFEEAALDKYVFMRNAYLQRRNHQIETNKKLGFITPTCAELTDPELNQTRHQLQPNDNTQNAFIPAAAQ